MTIRCCVIGGSGFIGSALVMQLLRTGRDIIILGRRDEMSVRVPAGARYASIDYQDRSRLADVLGDVDEIIDLAYATVPQTSYADPVYDILANLPASVSLLESIKGYSLKKFIFVSSGGTVYGPASDGPIVETHSTNPISPYGITKLTIEKYGLMYHRLHGVPFTIVRPSNAYGVGQRAFSGQGFIATAIGLMKNGEPVTVFGRSGTIRDYVHVSDVASGIVAALEYGQEGGIYNIGSGVGRSNMDVLQALKMFADDEGINVDVVHLPERKFDVPSNVLDSSRLTAVSGWSPEIPFERGLREMWDSM
jgi:UDP-glucose 4-epimerase